MSPRSFETYDIDEEQKFGCSFARDENGFVYVNKRDLIGLWSGSPNPKHFNKTDYAKKCEVFDVEYSERGFETQNSRGEYRTHDYIYLSSALCLLLQGSQRREVVLIEPFLECLVDFVGNNLKVLLQVPPFR